MGLSPYGFGVPARTDARPINALGSSKLIDVKTKGYVLDSNGNYKYMGDAQQLVYLAISSMNDFPDVIGDSFENDVKTQIQAALSPYVQRGILEIVRISITIYRANGLARPSILLEWKDVSTGEEFQERF
jgi:uncharacterized protein YdaL